MEQAVRLLELCHDAAVLSKKHGAACVHVFHDKGPSWIEDFILGRPGEETDFQLKAAKELKYLANDGLRGSVWMSPETCRAFYVYDEELADVDNVRVVASADEVHFTGWHWNRLLTTGGISRLDLENIAKGKQWNTSKTTKTA